MSVRKTKRGTTVIESRVDVKDLATLAKYYKNYEGDRPPNLSCLVSWIVEDLSLIMVANKRVDQVESVEAAKDILEDIVGRASTKRGERTLLRNIQLENIEREQAHEAEGWKDTVQSLLGKEGGKESKNSKEV